MRLQTLSSLHQIRLADDVVPVEDARPPVAWCDDRRLGLVYIEGHCCGHPKIQEGETTGYDDNESGRDS